MANSKELTKPKKQNEEIKALEEQREEALKVEKYNDAAVELYKMYDSYIKAGFTEEQAWKLTEILVNNSTKKKGIFKEDKHYVCKSVLARSSRNYHR